MADEANRRTAHRRDGEIRAPPRPIYRIPYEKKRRGLAVLRRVALLAWLSVAGGAVYGLLAFVALIVLWTLQGAPPQIDLMVVAVAALLGAIVGLLCSPAVVPLMWRASNREWWTLFGVTAFVSIVAGMTLLVPVGVYLLAALALGLAGWSDGRRRVTELPGWRCAGCMYDLSGLPASAVCCPECGAPRAAAAAVVDDAPESYVPTHATA